MKRTYDAVRRVLEPMRMILDALRQRAVARILRRPLVGYGLILLGGFIAFGLYSAWLGCDVSWDLKNYHYYSPYALLNGRVDLDYAPAQIQTYLNPISFVPFYLAVTHLEPIQTGFLLGGIHGISFGILFMMAHMLFASVGVFSRSGIALACAVLGTAGPLFLRQLGTSYNDILIAPLVLVALLLYLRSLLFRSAPDQAPGMRVLLLTGLLMGMAAGLKLVFLVWLVAFAIAVFVIERGWRGRTRAPGLVAVGSLVGFLVSRGYWMGLLWSQFGSPLFPFYNMIFRSPLYYDQNFTDDRFLPETVGSALRLPLETSDGRLGVFLGVVLLSVLALVGKAMWSRRGSRAVPDESGDAASGASKRETRAIVFLTIFVLVGLVIWEAQFSIARYVLPLELLAPLVVAGLLRASLTRRWPPILAILAIGSAVVVLLLPVRIKRTDWFDTYFNIDAPQFENPEEVLVILADDDPMSYIIPFFQPEVRFVCPWNNFTRTEKGIDPPLIVQEMVDVIRSHEGQILAIAPHHPKNVRRYGLAPLVVKGRREFEPAPLSPPQTDELRPLSSGLYSWPLELVPKGRGTKKSRGRK